MRNFRNALISPASHAAVIAMVAPAKVALSTLSGEVVLVTKSKRLPISDNFAKYESIASAIVAIGSKFLDNFEIRRCTEKNIITVKLASKAPQKPGAARKIVPRIKLSAARISAGISAPRHIRTSFCSDI